MRDFRRREGSHPKGQVVGTLDSRRFQRRECVAGERKSAGLDRIRADVERWVGIDDRSGPGGSRSVGGVEAHSGLRIGPARLRAERGQSLNSRILSGVIVDRRGEFSPGNRMIRRSHHAHSREGRTKPRRRNEEPRLEGRGSSFPSAALTFIYADAAFSCRCIERSCLCFMSGPGSKHGLVPSQDLLLPLSRTGKLLLDELFDAWIAAIWQIVEDKCLGDNREDGIGVG